MSTLNSTITTLLNDGTSADQIAVAATQVSTQMALSQQASGIPSGLPVLTAPQIVALSTFLFAPSTASSRDNSTAFDTQAAALVTALKASDTANSMNAILLTLKLVFAMRPDLIAGA